MLDVSDFMQSINYQEILKMIIYQDANIISLSTT